MTRYLLSVIEPDGPMPDPEFLDPIIQAVGVVDDAMRDAGVWVFAGGLHSPSTSTVLRAKDGEVLVTDGPYVEAKEHLGGFTIIDVPDLDEAIRVAKRFPGSRRGTVEIRPLGELAGLPPTRVAR